MNENELAINYKQVSVTLGEDGECICLLRGELDHHSVKEIREVIDEKLIDYRPMSVVFDLDEVTFTDSAGLGLVLGRYTRISAYGGKLMLINVPHDFVKILRLSGADRFLTIRGRANKTA
jgi:stage II sporulation protein AA (anti-sigma F factor antagonist)